ncbi:MAG: hypothetical protein WAS21_07430 [Geminicoccaceae bacterium]
MLDAPPQLPRRYSREKAAELLDMSVAQLGREIRAGRLGCYKSPGGRIVTVGEAHIADYLAHIEVRATAWPSKTDPASAATDSDVDQSCPRTGTSSGPTPPGLDGQRALALAQATFGPPSSPSPATSSSSRS